MNPPTEATEPPFPSFPALQPTNPPTEPPAAPSTTSPSVDPTGSVLPTQTAAPSESPTDDGGVAGITAKPHVTPPPTSTGGTPGTPNDGAWRIALIAMTGLLAMLLVMTPAARRR